MPEEPQTIHSPLDWLVLAGSSRKLRFTFTGLLGAMLGLVGTFGIYDGHRFNSVAIQTSGTVINARSPEGEKGGNDLRGCDTEVLFEAADGRQIHFKHGFSSASGTACRNMIGTTVLVAYDPANANDNIVGTSKSLVFPIGFIIVAGVLVGATLFRMYQQEPRMNVNAGRD